MQGVKSTYNYANLLALQCNFYKRADSKAKVVEFLGEFLSDIKVLFEGQPETNNSRECLLSDHPHHSNNRHATNVGGFKRLQRWPTSKGGAAATLCIIKTYPWRRAATPRQSCCVEVEGCSREKSVAAAPSRPLGTTLFLAVLWFSFLFRWILAQVGSFNFQF